MTENDALEVLKKPTEHIRAEDDDCIFSSAYARALETAMDALEEIQQYRAIGTVEELRQLKEKATAKKPNGIFFSREDGCRVGNCTSCGRYIKHREHKCCPRCGDLIDWGEGKE